MYRGHEVQRSVGVADLMMDEFVGDKGGYGRVEVERELNVHIRAKQINGICLSSVHEVVKGTDK